MKLTANIIRHYLNKRFRILGFRQGTGHVEYGMPFLHSAGLILKPGYIYVIDNNIQLPPKRMIPGEALYITTTDITYRLPDAASVITVAAEGVLLHDILNELLKCFAYYEQWTEKLTNIIDQQGSVDDMLKESVPYFNNPLCIMRSDLNILSSAGENIFPEGFRMFEAGEKKLGLFYTMMQDPRFSEMQNASAVYEGPDYILGFKTLNYNLKRIGDQTYAAAVFGAFEFNGIENDLLPVLGYYLKKAINTGDNNGNWKDNQLHVILEKILTDRTYDYMEASRRLSDLGWNKEHDYLCLTFYTDYHDQLQLPVSSICSYVEEMFPHSSSFRHKNNIVSFFNLTKLGQDYYSVSSKLAQFIRDGYLKAGYSRVMKGHMNLRRQYIQTVIALNVGSRKMPYNWIHQFDQIALTYILEQSARTLTGPMICHTGLLKLKDHDKRNGSDYYNTLEVYLRNQQNVVHTANALFIHRSTLLYRLEKIKEILESELDDPDELLYLNFSFRLLAMSDYGVNENNENRS